MVAVRRTRGGGGGGGGVFKIWKNRKILDLGIVEIKI